jgi:hypothetical protein
VKTVPLAPNPLNNPEMPAKFCSAQIIKRGLDNGTLPTFGPLKAFLKILFHFVPFYILVKNCVINNSSTYKSQTSTILLVSL